MDLNEKAEWIHNIQENVRSEKWVNAYVSYIERLDNRGVPVVFELDHLSEILGVQKEILTQAVIKPEKFYRTFTIPKSNGGERTIDAPYPFMLELQRWIANNILGSVRISEYAHGFAPEKSVITNAREHLGKSCILKLDIRNFFPSIALPRVVAIFRFIGYTPRVSYYLGTLCSLRNSLPQGGAASPVISNIVATPLDLRLAGLANQFGLNYSRYADDLTFSGDKIAIKFLSHVGAIIENEGFAINESKTRLIRGGGRRIVTGISIGSGSLKLPRPTRRKIRQEVYFIERNGVLNQSEREGIFDPVYVDRVIGKLNFWRSVEPENAYVRSKLALLSDFAKNAVQDIPARPGI